MKVVNVYERVQGKVEECKRTVNCQLLHTNTDTHEGKVNINIPKNQTDCS